MEQSSIRLRRAFTEATGFVTELVDSIGESEWSKEALEGWTVRELVVHTTRAASTIVEYAGETAQDVIGGAADYYVTVLSGEGVHESVSQRSREQAAAVDIPVPQYVHETFAEAEQVLARTPADQVLATRAGGVRLIDYLPTRVVELVVHGIDLADALGRDVAVPGEAMEVTLETMADLAVARPEVVDPAQVVRALTGRGSLPVSTNLLG